MKNKKCITFSATLKCLSNPYDRFLVQYEQSQENHYAN